MITPQTIVAKTEGFTAEQLRLLNDIVLAYKAKERLQIVERELKRCRAMLAENTDLRLVRLQQEISRALRRSQKPPAEGGEPER